MVEQINRSHTSVVARYLVVGLLLLAAFLRYVALVDIPPGVEHDEVAEMLIAEGILAGRHAVFFHEAYGQEPLFLYLVAWMRFLLGRNVLALRFVSASVGLLSVAGGTRLAKRLFGARVALVTMAGLSVMLWPVFWSRVGLRAMLLPLTLCLGLDALWAALSGRYPCRAALLAGLWLGASAYTYSAARGVPLLLLAFAVSFWLSERARFRARWRALLIAFLTAVVIAAPIAIYLVRNPAAQTRVHQVDMPLRALQQGDPHPVFENIAHVMGMFTVQGDASERNNFPKRPVFPEPIWGGLFYLGFLVAVTHFRDTRYCLLLVWLMVMLSPSTVTTEAPNFVRTLGALPVAMMLPGIGLEFLSRCVDKLGLPSALMGSGGMAVLLAVNVWLTGYTYFVRWPQIPEVRFVWQSDLKDVAEWLDAHPEVTAGTIGGLSPTLMDDPSLDLLMRREDPVVRWCNPGGPLSSGGGVLFPAEGGRFLLPSVVPLDGYLSTYMTEASISPATDHGSFLEYRLATPRPVNRSDVAFEGGATLLELDGPGRAGPGDVITMVSVWEAAGETHPDLKVFVHLVDADGELRAQSDGLDCPASFWRAGDRVVQLHPLELPQDLAPGRYSLRIGLYDRQTLQPYSLLNGEPYFEAAQLEIGGP